MIVVDANVIVPFFCASARTAVSQAVHERDPDWAVPTLWQYEFHNAMAKTMQAGLLSLDAALAAARHAAEALRPNTAELPFALVLPLCARHRITAYDAAYITLAQHLGCSLVTEDAELLRKFPDLALSMEAFLAEGSEPGVVREIPATYGRKNRRQGHTSTSHLPPADL